MLLGNAIIWLLVIVDVRVLDLHFVRVSMQALADLVMGADMVLLETLWRELFLEVPLWLIGGALECEGWSRGHVPSIGKALPRIA